MTRALTILFCLLLCSITILSFSYSPFIMDGTLRTWVIRDYDAQGKYVKGSTMVVQIRNPYEWGDVENHWFWQSPILKRDFGKHYENKTMIGKMVDGHDLFYREKENY